LPFISLLFSYERCSISGTVLGAFFCHPRSSLPPPTRGHTRIHEVSSKWARYHTRRRIYVALSGYRKYPRTQCMVTWLERYHHIHRLDLTREVSRRHRISTRHKKCHRILQKWYCSLCRTLWYYHHRYLPRDQRIWIIGISFLKSPL
jgi:hypothetical protein